MTECTHIQEIGAYHDGQLDAARAETIERHLRECPACAAELAQLQGISQWFAEAAEAPSMRLSQMSLHRLYAKAEATLDQSILRAARWISAVAAIVLVASGAWLMKMQPSQTTAPQQALAPPPWVDVAVASYTDSSSLDTSTPAAVWYLASAQDTSR
jgi:anti-sigma factor RsiW